MSLISFDLIHGVYSLSVYNLVSFKYKRVPVRFCEKLNVN